MRHHTRQYDSENKNLIIVQHGDIFIATNDTL